MSAQRRVALLVAAVAVAAVAVVAAAILTSDGDSAGTEVSTTSPGLREGRPPLSFALGFRSDPEARAITRGAALYARGNLTAASALFAKHDSLEAKVGAAFAAVRFPRA